MPARILEFTLRTFLSGSGSQDALSADGGAGQVQHGHASLQRVSAFKGYPGGSAPPEDVGFQIATYFNNGSNDIVPSGFVNVGADVWSPTMGNSSNFLTAFSVQLKGIDAPRYRVKYGALLAKFYSNNLFQPIGTQSFGGSDEEGHPFAGLTQKEDGFIWWVIGLNITVTAK
jgi:hypothetical protein